MKQKKHAIFIAVVVLITAITMKTNAQPMVTGQVKDVSTKEKMAYCTASVYNLNDSLVTGGITNDKGYFQIPLNAGSYKLVFSYLGYHNDTMQIEQGNENNFVGVVTLMKNATQLQEVQIKSTTSEFNIDKDVQLVTAKLREGSTTTADVLGRMKGLAYDRYNNSVKVDGEENIIILVNGLEKNQEYIKNLPPERVKEVEIIRNPSGRYALEGYAAVVNIVLKSDYRGTDLYADNMLIFDYDSEEETYIPINNTSLTFNYTHEKLNFYMKGFNSYTNLFIKNEASQVYKDNGMRIENLSPGNSNNLLVDNMYNTFTIGADYYLNPKHTLSFESNISALPKSRENIAIDQDVRTYFNDSLVDSYSYNTRNESKRGDITGAFYHIFKMDDKSQLKTDFTFSRYEEDYLNSVLQGNGYRRFEDGLNTKDYTQFYTEYDLSLNEKSSIMAGYGNTWRQINNSFYTRTGVLAGSELINDTSEFSLTETRNKFYAYYSRKLSKKLSVKLGAASELSHPKSGELDKTYFIVKPHLDFFVKAHELLSAKFKYRTYIDYPRINQVNPFTRVMDTYNIEKGNPKLKPEVTHVVSAKIKLLQGLISAEPYYNFSNNYIARTITPLGDSIVHSYNNVGDFMHKGIKGDITIPLFKQSFIIQSGVDIYESSISYNGNINTVNDVRVNGQMFYVDKKTEAVTGIILQKNMVKNINAQGYGYNDNDYWLFIAQKPFFKKKLTAMVGYMLPLNLWASYDQGSYTETDFYYSKTSTDINVLKNLILFKLTYRFSKGKSVRELQKEVKGEKEKEKSGGFF